MKMGSRGRLMVLQAKGTPGLSAAACNQKRDMWQIFLQGFQKESTLKLHF